MWKERTPTVLLRGMGGLGLVFAGGLCLEDMHPVPMPGFAAYVSDSEALRSDWEAVGTDLCGAMFAFERSCGLSLLEEYCKEVQAHGRVLPYCPQTLTQRSPLNTRR